MQEHLSLALFQFQTVYHLLLTSASLSKMWASLLLSRLLYPKFCTHGAYVVPKRRKRNQPITAYTGSSYPTTFAQTLNLRSAHPSCLMGFRRCHQIPKLHCYKTLPTSLLYHTARVS